MLTDYASGPKGDIWVELLDKKDGNLSFNVSVSADLGKYFKTDVFFLKYDKDLADVSESILYIPVVANLAPVAWAAGADLHVRELDKAFAESLGTIKNIMKGWFPGFSFAGNICIDHLVSNRFGGSGCAQLFSAGIDSTATYARHRDETPDLIYFGIIKPFDETLERMVFKEVSDFAQKEGVVLHRVESNMHFTFFDHLLLLSDFGKTLKGGTWWASAQHGLALLGMCAPLTAIHDIGKIYIASSVTKDQAEGLGRPWGSHPLIDNSIAWADVKCAHDGAEWSRQEKIRYAIKPHIDRTHHHPTLIVCNEAERGSVLNCGGCEKCSRTIVGLALEGIDPNRCGLKADDRTFGRIKRKLLLRPLRFTYLTSGMWKDLRSAIPDTIAYDMYGSKKFLEWLRTYEIPDDMDKDTTLSQRVLQKCLRLGIIP